MNKHCKNVRSVQEDKCKITATVSKVISAAVQMTSTMNYLICCYSGTCLGNQLLHFAAELIVLGFACCKNSHDKRAAALYCRLKTKVHFKNTPLQPQLWAFHTVNH